MTVFQKNQMLASLLLPSCMAGEELMGKAEGIPWLVSLRVTMVQGHRMGIQSLQFAPPLITGTTGSLVGSVRARADPKGICLLPTHPQAGPHGPYLGMAQSCTCCLKRHS